VTVAQQVETAQLPETASQQSASDQGLDQTSAREDARNDRIQGAAGVIPTPLRIVLFFLSAVIFVFMLFFADRGERAIVQAMLVCPSTECSHMGEDSSRRRPYVDHAD